MAITTTNKTKSADLPAPALSGVVGGVLGLGAFSVAVTTGLFTGGEAAAVLWRGIVAMTLCYGVGWAIGSVAMVVIRNHIDDYHQSNPVPEIPSLEQTAQDDEPVTVDPVDHAAAAPRPPPPARAA